MQQVGIFGLRRGTKESEITKVEVPFDGSVEAAWRYVLRFCKESYNWPDTITLGGGLDRTEEGLRLQIVERRPATDEERRAHGIPNSAENVMTDGEVVGSIEFVRATSKRSILICKSVTADCQRFMDALEQKLNAQRLIAGDVLRLPATSGALAEPQVDSGVVAEEELPQAAEKGWRRATPDIMARARARSRRPPRPPVRGDDAVDAVIKALWAEANLDTEVHRVLLEHGEGAPIAYTFDRQEIGEIAEYTIYLDDGVPAGHILIIRDPWTSSGWSWRAQPTTKSSLLGAHFSVLCWWIKTLIEIRFSNLVKWDVLEQELSDEQAEPQADKKRGGRPGLDCGELIYRLAKAQEGEEKKRADPSKTWKEIAKEIKWRLGTNKAAIKLLEDARHRLHRLEKEDPEHLLGQAKAYREEEGKEKKKT